MKIIFSGGGTLGPVIPLLAMREAIIKKYPQTKFIWVGTKTGPERDIVKAVNVPFFVISAGKFRRYFSFWNILDIFKILLAFIQSLLLIIKEKPDLLISAGGFVSVPLHWAGFLLGIPAWIHQQDVQVGLANRLMVHGAKKITTALSVSTNNLPKNKTEWLGNPCRDLSVTREQLGAAAKLFNVPPGSPVIFALGGGTGSASINKLLLDALSHWPANWHVIHLIGLDRPVESTERAAAVFPNYHVFKFFTYEMALAYALADVVVARAGFSTLTELAAESKAAVIYPIYGTHQEQNARFFAEAGGVILLEEGTDVGNKLAKIVEELIHNPAQRAQLGAKFNSILPCAKPERIVEIFEEITKQKSA